MLNTIRNIGGGVKLEDVNPEKSNIDMYSITFANGSGSSISVKNYKYISIGTQTFGSNFKIYIIFYKKDGTCTRITTDETFSSSYIWTKYYEIPDDTETVYIIGVGQTTGWYGVVHYSLLA